MRMLSYPGVISEVNDSSKELLTPVKFPWMA